MPPSPPEMLTPEELAALKREGREALHYARRELSRDPERKSAPVTEMLTPSELESLKRKSRDSLDWMREELRRNPALKDRT